MQRHVYVSLGEKRVILMRSSDVLRSTTSAVTLGFVFVFFSLRFKKKEKKCVRLVSSYSGTAMTGSSVVKVLPVALTVAHPPTGDEQIPE